MDEKMVHEIVTITEGWKFLVAVFAFVVLPNVINLINNILNKKNLTSTIKEFQGVSKTLSTMMSSIDYNIQSIKENNNEEATLKQIEIVFAGCSQVSIYELEIRTTRLIELNHIDDKVNTERKIRKFSQDILNNTKAKLSSFKRHSKPVSCFIKDDWTDDIVKCIQDFVYTKNKEYNYNVLTIKLNELFESFAYTFNKDVAHFNLEID